MIAGGAVGDFNRDGLQDIYVIAGQPNEDRLYINNGDGTFAPYVAYGTGFAPRSVVASDLDGDGDVGRVGHDGIRVGDILLAPVKDKLFGQGFALGLAQGQAAVNEERAVIGQCVATGRLAPDLSDGQGTLPEERVAGQARGKQFDAKDEACCIVDGIAAQGG